MDKLEAFHAQAHQTASDIIDGINAALKGEAKFRDSAKEKTAFGLITAFLRFVEPDTATQEVQTPES